jgi:hypothetical protein
MDAAKAKEAAAGAAASGAKLAQDILAHPQVQATAKKVRGGAERGRNSPYMRGLWGLAPSSVCVCVCVCVFISSPHSLHCPHLSSPPLATPSFQQIAENRHVQKVLADPRVAEAYTKLADPAVQRHFLTDIKAVLVRLYLFLLLREGFFILFIFSLARPPPRFTPPPPPLLNPPLIIPTTARRAAAQGRGRRRQEGAHGGAR